MRARSTVSCLLLSFAIALPLLAQGQPMARLTGRVADRANESLPGVLVTLVSPQLQGERVLVTDEHGIYHAPPLPPGDYEITFRLEGYQTVASRVRLSANLRLTVDAGLDLATVAEQIVVTAEAVDTLSRDSTAALTVTKRDLDDLPVDRTLDSAVDLAPGGISQFISGGASWENLFTLNGAVLNDNWAGIPHLLYVEDAIQEVTTASAGVSAEWGRFTGGLVTALTRSGGNLLEGSYRGTWTNEDWNGRNELTPEDRIDATHRTDEATLGGRILRDRLWFFTAGRSAVTEETRATPIFGTPYPFEMDDKRFEVKLTGGTASHQLRLSHLETDETWTNVPHANWTGAALIVDDGTLNPRVELPAHLSVASYSGVFTPSFFLEAQYSERAWNPQSYGGRDPAVDSGTPIWDTSLGVIYNESYACDSEAIEACRPELRDNEQARIAATSFWSTRGGGSHELAFGWESFSGITAGDENLSANDLMVYSLLTSELDFDAQRAYPTAPGSSDPGATLLGFHPVLVPYQAPDIRTSSFFANDRWRLGERWAFSLGLRYDANEATNTAGLEVAKDSAWSPRLGLSWDPGAKGRNLFHASLGIYVGPQPEGLFNDSSAAGASASFYYGYSGPPIGVDYGNRLDPVAANAVMWGWLGDVCPNAIDFDDTRNLLDPLDCDYVVGWDIPGVTTIPSPDLGSSTAQEISLGYQREFGRFGSLRADWVHREFGNFFATKRDLETGRGATEWRGELEEFDLGIVVNEDELLERTYDGLHVTFSFRFLDSRLRWSGSYTWADLRGNYLTSQSSDYQDALEYPEYHEVEWSVPSREIYRGHRLRTWVQYDLVDTARHRLNVSWLEHLVSGLSYGAVGEIDTRPYVVNPGYLTPPTSQQYVFETDSGTIETVHRSDLALNYSLSLGRWELFVQPAARNLFDEDAVDGVYDGVLTASNDDSLEAFDPFTETPVEGVHWRRGHDPDRPVASWQLQDVRSLSVTAGIRFNP